MDTLARIKDLATRELSLDPAKIDPNAPLADLGVDSLTFIEFMFKVEEEFGVSVSDEDLKGIRTLADLERHVAAALAAAGKACRIDASTTVDYRSAGAKQASASLLSPT